MLSHRSRLLTAAVVALLGGICRAQDLGAVLGSGLDDTNDNDAAGDCPDDQVSFEMVTG